MIIIPIGEGFAAIARLKYGQNWQAKIGHYNKHKFKDMWFMFNDGRLLTGTAAATIVQIYVQCNRLPQGTSAGFASWSMLEERFLCGMPDNGSNDITLRLLKKAIQWHEKQAETMKEVLK